MFNVPTLESIRQSILRDMQSFDPNADISVDSDNYARASALAACAEGVYSHQKWIIKQSFPDTADSEFLEKHAAVRGLRRKNATYAAGTLCATVTGQANATISQGAQIKTNDNRFYVVNDDVTLSGEGTAKISVRALSAGSAQNIKSATPATFLTTQKGVQSDLILNDVVGGTDAETDSSLLARLLEKIRRPAAGGNRYDYKNWALEVDGVDKAYIYPLRRGLGTVDIVITSDNDLPSEQTIKNCQAYIDEVRPVTAKESKVIKPDVTKVDFDIKVALSGVSLSEITQTIKAALEAHFNTLAPADNLIVSQCEAIVSDLIGVIDRKISLPSANKTADIKSKIEWFRLGNVTVSELEA